MSLFSKFRRNSTAPNRNSASYEYSGPARPRHERHNRARYDTGGTVSHAVSVESIPYLPSETARGASSEVSLRSEYTHLDNDTSRYPKWSTPTSSAPSTTHNRRGEEAHNEVTTSALKFSVVCLIIFNIACGRRAESRKPSSPNARFRDNVFHMGRP